MIEATLVPFWVQRQQRSLSPALTQKGLPPCYPCWSAPCYPLQSHPKLIGTGICKDFRIYAHGGFRWIGKASCSFRNVNTALSREGEKLGWVMKKFFALAGGKAPLYQWKKVKALSEASQGRQLIISLGLGVKSLENWSWLRCPGCNTSGTCVWNEWQFLKLICTMAVPQLRITPPYIFSVAPDQL